ncbi:riboflavin biosynthesis protein RibD [Alicyclobacillus hesperidum URH17-3-68]|uniref:Riboflavin biosynthesis protein RibD n=1 Tax=Alicyclobacillus hesperidum TaxID=89784 RepID=A0A1H2RTG6_9BACL|nr:bifunctional diaminohydroxyphosphoribosylaminopyrimidine deaminase/5-amino-6-(5-phosphoribosylamino)uracil reductase RibD [Alicyclobacillus hesperidum]EJY55342.1 riboflavin biosynthesis protein RibD [Alicyclobacillus hesperidum URH17-3-68]GLV13474.1 riboflavin biosynthesis protein RibD [Alicyclobacillus hesperidum]SDW22617.1 diaminohydroxyphosphoribosylaminopyrimidine deaminase [Alicyclobacillus hesperidum]
MQGRLLSFVGVFSLHVDEHFMRYALAVASLGGAQTSPNPRVGAVVVRDGEIVGQGAHLKPGDPHAEIYALRMAGEKAQGATIYVTLEPCNHHGRTPPCSEAILASGIKRVVVAVLDTDPRTAGGGVARLRDHGIDVTVGVLEDEARALNRAFFHRLQSGRPLVVYKAALTLSGHVAANTGHSQYVTGPLARADVQRLRMEHPGIAVGIGTVLADDPRLTVRNSDTEQAGDWQPLRVIFDSGLRLPASARMLAEPGQTVIVTTPSALADERRVQEIEAAGQVVWLPVAGDKGRTSLTAALPKLAALGLNSILLEGGPTLAAAFLQDRLIDDVCFYVAPKLLLNGLPPFLGAVTQSMAEAIALHHVAVRQVGDDLCITGRVKYAP